MAYYRVCPDCGAHLDPGERCDCRDQNNKEKTNDQTGLRQVQKRDQNPKKKLYILGREVWCIDE